MKSRIVLDTGPITLYYSKKPPFEIDNLMQTIKNGEVEAEVTSSVLVEFVNQICISKGREKAAQSLESFTAEVPVNVIQLDNDLIYKAGLLKCQFRGELSYIDCISITLAQRDHAILQTTEKELEPLHIPNLRVKKYHFKKN
jgi:predicted nucleic acid-binding protein